MKIDREAVKTWSEIIKTVLGIVAVGVGAFWALYIYGHKDAPTLEPRFKSTYTINWQNTPDRCQASFRVDLDNIGIASYTIDRVHVQGWNFERVDEPVGGAEYFELNRVKQDKDRFFDRTYNTIGQITFLRRFPPSTGTGHTFQWTFPRQENRWIFLSVDFYKRGDTDPETFVGTWQRICGD